MNYNFKLLIKKTKFICCINNLDVVRYIISIIQVCAL